MYLEGEKLANWRKSEINQPVASIRCHYLWAFLCFPPWYDFQWNDWDIHPGYLGYTTTLQDISKYWGLPPPPPQD